jgi:hypothetical protein
MVNEWKQLRFKKNGLLKLDETHIAAIVDKTLRHHLPKLEHMVISASK